MLIPGVALRWWCLPTDATMGHCIRTALPRVAMPLRSPVPRALWCGRRHVESSHTKGFLFFGPKGMIGGSSSIRSLVLRTTSMSTVAKSTEPWRSGLALLVAKLGAKFTQSRVAQVGGLGPQLALFRLLLFFFFFSRRDSKFDLPCDDSRQSARHPHTRPWQSCTP
jgi:hypothetical protein